VSVQNEWVTHREAAEILGCGVSNVPKLITKGELTPRRQPDGRRVRAGCLSRQEVEQLADQRREAASAKPREPRPYQRVDHRPDTDHLWLSPAAVAEQLGVTAQAIRQRVKRGRLPAVENGGRIWIRADHFHQVEAARTATATRRP
jgi:excisionase family DNA binding protein